MSSHIVKVSERENVSPGIRTKSIYREKPFVILNRDLAVH